MNTPAPVPAPSFHPALRFAAEVVSVVLHPLFVPVYVLFFTIYESPVTMPIDPQKRFFISVSICMAYVGYPLFVVFITRKLGLIDSIRLRTSRDRIIPYVACGIFYFWMWYVLHKEGSYPVQLSWFSLAVFLASSGGLILNNYLKVSMHAIGAGTAVGYFYLLAATTPLAMGFYLVIALLLAGLVCTARLIRNEHTPAEVYAGFFLGILASGVAYWFS
ncbi:MAG: phosphatase PAP2 family protein [Chitinophagaceae bacterium]|nr:MAG: phosphatase PAP2 family protein [Chitinophagaceae bacterium]